jgi:RNA polymerase sigma factor (sigma-70 family)
VSETAQNEMAPPTGEVSQLAEHLFRHESGKLVSVLTGIFGMDRLQLAEDVVQEALGRAMQTWPFYGVPKNPGAWLTQTAKNLALDVLRREKNFRDKEQRVIAFIEQWGGDADSESPQFESEIKDGRLRLMFACCHPVLPQEMQIALALKTLCGFSPNEIANAFLTSEAAIAKRLVRARQKIRDAGVRFEIPAGEELSSRLDGVLHTLYLLFNEGYKASSGETLLREDLCSEAIRLATSLVEHPTGGNQPRAHALLALMLLNAARSPARLDANGNILRLKEQDRSAWDRGMIARGLFHLNQSATGDEVSEYHLQAGISACHCAAAEYGETDWPRILSMYDSLIELDDSPIIALNRAVAVAHVHGPAAGIKAVQASQKRQSLAGYYLLYAALAEFEMQLKDFPNAAEHLRQAIENTEMASEKTFLSERLRECETALGTGTP